MARETQERSKDPADGDKDRPLEAGLHLLATPIGALGDLSHRGLSALRQADVLVCEDTRMLRKLMDLHGAPLAGRPLLTYHEHNADTARRKIFQHLEAGRSVVMASDAGTPLIADPGYKLVRAAREAGHRVTALPGPCAAITALVLSGLPTDAFSFIGFPPPKSGARRKLFESWAAAPGSLVLYESPRRLPQTMLDLAEVLGGEREAAIARELTKKFEEVISGRLSQLALDLAQTETIKGEIVIVVGPPAPSDADTDAIDAALLKLLQTETLKDAARIVAEQLGAPKKLVYGRALSLKGTRHDSDDG